MNKFINGVTKAGKSVFINTDNVTHMVQSTPSNKNHLGLVDVYFVNKAELVTIKGEIKKGVLITTSLSDPSQTFNP